jgi:putative acetyltransferase
VPDRPDSPIGRELIRELDTELLAMYPPVAHHGLHPGDAADPRLLFLVAWAGDVAAGCGAVRPLEPGTGEVKRMFVRRQFRGKGISRMVLAELEKLWTARGDTCLRLETGSRQLAALSLYDSSGYVRIPAYGEYVGGEFSVCFEKRLARLDGRTP